MLAGGRLTIAVGSAPAARPDSGAVRRLVDVALSGDDIDDLALDHFPQVYRDFVAGTGRRARIRQLVEYASRQDRLDELVALVRSINPAAVDRSAEPGR